MDWGRTGNKQDRGQIGQETDGTEQKRDRMSWTGKKDETGIGQDKKPGQEKKGTKEGQDRTSWTRHGWDRTYEGQETNRTGEEWDKLDRRSTAERQDRRTRKG